MPDGEILLAPEKEYQKQYRLSSWWIEHRDGLRRVGVIVFAVLDAMIILFAGWNLLDAFVISYAGETRAVLEMAAYGQGDLRAYTVANAAKDMEVGTPTAVASTTGAFDLYATVTNPNQDWWAEFDYSFSSSSVKTDSAKAFVLPGETRPLVVYAVASSAAPRGVSLKLENVVWHRVDHHVTGAVDVWLSEHLDFAFENPTFETVSLDSGTTGAAAAAGKPIGRVSFGVKNDTAYSYYEPAFVIVLTRGSTVVGVTGTTLGSIDAGESVNVDVNWFGSIPAVSKVEVFPVVNPFDILTYKPLQGETTEDTRTRVFPRH